MPPRGVEVVDPIVVVGRDDHRKPLGIGQRLVKRDAELRGDDAVAFGDAHQDRVIERGMTDGTVELNRAWRWRR